MDPATIALSLRRVLLSGVLGIALLIPASVIPWPGAAATCAAGTTHRVAVVVQHLNGSPFAKCVSFTSATIIGEQALAVSGIEAGLLPSGGFGNAVCQLDGEPAAYPPTCWTGTSPFWALFVAHGGAWVYSSVGLSSLTLHDGDAVGFRYQSQSEHAPPSIQGDCPDPTEPPASPKPTPKPRPTTRPTDTPPNTTSTPPAASLSTPGLSAPGLSPAPLLSPSASPSADAAAIATGPMSPGESAGALATATPTEPPTARAASTGGGAAPVGLILAAVAALAFVALGVIHLRRSP